ncbi:hypothetical protein [Microviridae sp.]|nr:hypothetical protein [Microviridae sp.]
MRWYIRSRKHHSRKRPREQRSYPLVRRSRIPQVTLLDRPILTPRGMRLTGAQRSALVLRSFKQYRFPLVGQRVWREHQTPDVQSYPARVLFDDIKQVPAVNSVCQARSLRRRVLFGFQVAGRNKRRSPGRDGTYNRTVDSETSCRRS